MTLGWVNIDKLGQHRPFFFIYSIDKQNLSWVNIDKFLKSTL